MYEALLDFTYLFRGKIMRSKIILTIVTVAIATMVSIPDASALKVRCSDPQTRTTNGNVNIIPAAERKANNRLTLREKKDLQRKNREQARKKGTTQPQDSYAPMKFEIADQKNLNYKVCNN